MKSEEAESIIRFLASEGNFGKESTPYRIAEELSGMGLSITNKKVYDILRLIVVKFTDIMGYKKIGAYHLFWVIAEKDSFQKWFKEWFGKEFEGK